MSTYVLMRILESAPSRYDLGIGLLTLGRLGAAYDRLASHVGPGQRVLDLGCGTGALALRAARGGAAVKGIDVNPQMLEIAERRAREASLADRVELREMGVAELEAEPADSYDAVMSGLCFSELSQDELRYTLQHVRRILVESAWHSRHRPAVGAKLRKRREGHPAWVITHADRAMSRLSRRYRALQARGKPHNKIVAAVARELAGFVWAVLQEGHQRQHEGSKPSDRVAA